MAWGTVYLIMAALVVVLMVVAVTAPDTERPPSGVIERGLEQAGEVSTTVRFAALAIVGVCWVWAIVSLGVFMASMLNVAPGEKPPSVADFTTHVGPWIIVATVFVPLVVSATVNWLKSHGRGIQHEQHSKVSAGRAAMNHIYGALVSPLAELSSRLGWGVLIIIGFILTYALCYNIWSSFAFPFYLDYLHYTKDQVAFASKVFGIFMTMIGISVGGYLFTRIGRFPTVILGAAVTPLGNLLYADLAEGGANIDAFTHTVRLSNLLGFFGADDRMSRLLVAICYENIATGIALTAFVAYLSGIISKKFTAVQYALLSSLTFLVGSLGRGVAGESFDKYGYPLVFRWTAAAGLIAVFFVILEWIRVASQERREKEAADTAPKVAPVKA
jgi:PAT family beta-lactamase induction signal transducer AmpG